MYRVKQANMDISSRVLKQVPTYSLTVKSGQLQYHNDVSVFEQSLSLLRSILTILLTCPNSDTLLCYSNNPFLAVLNFEFTSLFPFSNARPYGVALLLSLRDRIAPSRISSSTMDVFPASAASWRGVRSSAPTSSTSAPLQT